MKPKEEILEGVKEILTTVFKIAPSSIKDETRLMEDLKLDSVDLLDALFLVEEKFHVKITADGKIEGSPPQTVGELVQRIYEKQTKNYLKNP